MIEFVDEDDWEAHEGAEAAARNSGIRISRNKELTLIARYRGEAVAGVWTSFMPDNDSEAYVFDFDIAVSPEHRGMMLGPKLIEKTIQYYKNLASDSPYSYIRVHVVNPKLAKYLEDRYGFDPDHGGWSRDNPFMTLY